MLREEVDGNASNPEMMFIEKHLFSHIAGSGKLYCLMLSNSFWGSMKSAGYTMFAYYMFFFCYLHVFIKSYSLFCSSPPP